LKKCTEKLIICVQGCHFVPQSETPVEVVFHFGECYGTPCMDSVVELTTVAFRDNRPGSVWVMETWKDLHRIKYRHISSRVLDSRVRQNRAVVILQSRIGTIAGHVDQREIFLLIRESGLWKIDDIQVTDEVPDIESFLL